MKRKILKIKCNQIHKIIIKIIPIHKKQNLIKVIKINFMEFKGNNNIQTKNKIQINFMA